MSQQHGHADDLLLEAISAWKDGQREQWLKTADANDEGARARFDRNLDSRSIAITLSGKVRRWVSRITEEFDVRQVSFDQVYFFGSKVGYVMARAEAFSHDGKPVPGLALIRGDSVAVLPVLHAPDGRDYTVLVRQPRLAVGHPAYEEIPAGMVDEGVFLSKAIDELNEEVGADLEIVEADLVLLETIHPSPGGCDEALSIFYARKTVTMDLIQALTGRRNSQVSESENIVVEVIPLEDLATRANSDMKSRLAYLSYCAHMAMLPRMTPVGGDPETASAPGPC